MKKLLLLCFIASFYLGANAQCTPAFVSQGMIPLSANVPCVVQGQAFSQTYSGVFPTTVQTATVNSVTINNITGLPSGLTVTYGTSSQTYAGGSSFCFVVSGTTNDACGQYKMGINVTVSTTIFGQTYQSSGDLFAISATQNLGFSQEYLRVYGSTSACPAVRDTTVAFWAYTGCAPFSVTTSPATLITSTSVQLNGTANPNGTNGSLEFEWGTNTSYGNSGIASPSNVGGTNAVTVTGSLTSLAPGTTYHYRLKGVASSGTFTGSDQSFTTSGHNGIADIDLTGVRLSPNPSDGSFVLNIDNIQGQQGQLRMINAEGKECLHQTVSTGQNQINAHNLADGIYTIQVISNLGSYTQRMIISRW